MIDKSYIAGLYDGDGSVNMSLVGPEGKQGFLMKVELSQNDKNLIHIINEYFGNLGSIYTDSREGRNDNYNLRFCGKKAYDILKIIEEYGIIKSPQASVALEYLNNTHKKFEFYEENVVFMNKIKTMNSDKTVYPKQYERINNAYISGLFDAEGNVYFNTLNNKKRSYVKITQNGCPEILDKIKEYLGYGSTSEVGRYKIYSKSNYNSFLIVVKPTNIMKIQKLEELIDFL